MRSCSRTNHASLFPHFHTATKTYLLNFAGQSKDESTSSDPPQNQHPPLTARGIKYLDCYILTYVVLPAAFVALFTVTWTVLLVYTFHDHAAIPTKMVEGLAGSSGVFFVLMILGLSYMCSRKRCDGRKAGGASGADLESGQPSAAGSFGKSEWRKNVRHWVKDFLTCCSTEKDLVDSGSNRVMHNPSLLPVMSGGRGGGGGGRGGGGLPPPTMPPRVHLGPQPASQTPEGPNSTLNPEDALPPNPLLSDIARDLASTLALLLQEIGGKPGDSPFEDGQMQTHPNDVRQLLSPKERPVTQATARPRFTDDRNSEMERSRSYEGQTQAIRQGGGLSGYIPRAASPISRTSEESMGQRGGAEEYPGIGHVVGVGPSNSSNRRPGLDSKLSWNEMRDREIANGVQRYDSSTNLTFQELQESRRLTRSRSGLAKHQNTSQLPSDLHQGRDEQDMARTESTKKTVRFSDSLPPLRDKFTGAD